MHFLVVWELGREGPCLPTPAMLELYITPRVDGSLLLQYYKIDKSDIATCKDLSDFKAV